MRSTPGKGTVFWIEVPRGDANQIAPARAGLRRGRAVTFRTRLVVEDETSVRTSLSRLLKAKGMQAIAVATADDALAQIQQQQLRPDFLICDYNLRGSVNGVDTINVLRGHLPGTYQPSS